MAQPFLAATDVCFKPWDWLSVACYRDYIAICSEFPLYTISSAIFGGGAGERRIFTNWRVPLHYRCDQPAADAESFLKRRGLDTAVSVAMLTAADLRLASVREIIAEQFRLFCCVTAGTSNAVRTDNRLPAFAETQPGTINCLLMIDARVAEPALINAVVTATEAKCAALQDLNVTDGHGRTATGTSTDAIAVACSQRSAFAQTHLYAGPASLLGNAVGKVVYEAVYEAVSAYKEKKTP
ncbi:MAG TPA: adenosylcobinamide amidohydrolase [Bacilli bacterium]